MKRRVEPEWLDELSPDDPAAAASRRDLQRINRIMGHARIMANSLLTTSPCGPAGRMVEIGAGDGTFLLHLARLLSPRWPAMQAVLVDRADSVRAETRAGFRELGWSVEVVTADVFDWLRSPALRPADIMVANLFLHHFQAGELALLLRLVSERTQLFVACEPWRSPVALAFSRMLGIIGCNAVTRHDAVVSVRAGFAGAELSKLWPAQPKWKLRERSARWFTHAFVAGRIA